MEDSKKLREELQDECALVKIMEHKKEDHPWLVIEKNRIVGIPFVED